MSQQRDFFLVFLCYNKTMKDNKPLLISLIVIVSLFIGAIILFPIFKNNKEDDSSSNVSVDIAKYNHASYIEGNEDNGGIADHIKGDPSAPVTIYEYGDYQCSGCANFNPWAKQLLKEYEGKLRIIFRSFPLSIHNNAVAASSAAEAAGLQGYWEEYGDLLFSNQAEWFYSKGSNRINYFVSYFEDVTDGKGDVNKFRSDMASAEVKKKVNFDAALAKSLNITATPAFFGEDGSEIEWILSDEQTKADTLKIFRNYIDKELEKKGLN